MMMLHSFILLYWWWRYSLIGSTTNDRWRIWSTWRWWSHFWWNITSNIFYNYIRRYIFHGFIIFKFITIRTGIIIFLEQQFIKTYKHLFCYTNHHFRIQFNSFVKQWSSTLSSFNKISLEKKTNSYYLNMYLLLPLWHIITSNWSLWWIIRIIWLYIIIWTLKKTII